MAGVTFWESGIDGEEALVNGDGTLIRKINATFASNPWDVAFISGLRLPGLCEVLDGLTQIGVDNKNPDGKDGSTLTLKGYRPGPFEISCVCWTRAQDTELQEIEDVVWRRPQKKTKVASVAVDVYHPALERRGISTGALVGITFPRPGPFEGSKIVHFKFIENSPPGPKNQTKTAGKVIKVREAARFKSDPVNAGPGKPSQNRASLGPGGPAPTPANGPT